MPDQPALGLASRASACRAPACRRPDVTPGIELALAAILERVVQLVPQRVGREQARHLVLVLVSLDARVGVRHGRGEFGRAGPGPGFGRDHDIDDSPQRAARPSSWYCAVAVSGLPRNHQAMVVCAFRAVAGARQTNGIGDLAACGPHPVESYVERLERTQHETRLMLERVAAFGKSEVAEPLDDGLDGDLHFQP